MFHWCFPACFKSWLVLFKLAFTSWEKTAWRLIKLRLVKYQDCGTTKKIRLSQNIFDQFESNFAWSLNNKSKQSFPWPKGLKWQLLSWHLFLMKTNKLNFLCVSLFHDHTYDSEKINEIPKLVKISRTHPIRSMSPWKLPKKGKLDENFPGSTRHTRAR